MRPQNRFVKKTKKSTFAFEKVEMLKGEQKVSVKNLRGLEASQFTTLFIFYTLFFFGFGVNLDSLACNKVSVKNLRARIKRRRRRS